MTAAIKDIWGSRAFRVGIAQAILLAMLGVAVGVIASRFRPIYADFGMALPVLTQLVLGVAQVLARFWYVCFLPLCAWPFVFWGVASLLSGRSGAATPNRLWVWLTWLVLILLVTVVTFAILRPFFTLLTNLSSSW